MQDQIDQFKESFHILKKLKKFNLSNSIKAFRTIFTTLNIKLILATWCVILMIIGKITNKFALKNIIILLILLLIITLYDEWKKPDWRIRNKEKLRKVFLKENGWDYQEKIRERKQKKNDEKV